VKPCTSRGGSFKGKSLGKGSDIVQVRRQGAVTFAGKGTWAKGKETRR